MDAPPEVIASPPDAPAPSTEPRRRIPRWVFRVVRDWGIFYLVVLAVLFALQTKLIFPGAATQGDPGAIVEPRPGEELVTLKTRNGDRVVALFAPALRPDGARAPDASTRPAILYFYGNGMCLFHAEEQFRELRHLGFNVMIPEYVGYGMSSGQAGEAGCFATADAAFDHLLTRKDIDTTRIVAAGWSLGGAVAIDLASRRPVAGLIAFSTFTSMVDMAHRNYPFLPARLLLQHKFESLAKMPRVACPILLGHGRDDKLIPYAMSDRLARAAQTPVTRLAIPDAGHNDFYMVGGSQIYPAIQRFVDSLPAREATP